MQSIDGKVIWVTGASSGIGETLTYALDKKNCKLIISSRDEIALNRVKNNCLNSHNIKILTMDLADFATMNQKVEDALSFFGELDILVNNAGISQRSLIIDTDFEVYKILMDINYLGTVALSKAILPYFKANNNGHFVIVTSLMGKFGSPYRSGYCGAKHALHGFFDALRLEHDKDNIKVTMICPGFVNTDVARNALTADGSKQGYQDDMTENGLQVDIFVKRMLNAIRKEKYEAYIGKFEKFGVFVKRLSPRLLHKLILRSKVK